MMAGTYVGLLKHLHGQHALLQREEPHGYLAQFDGHYLSRFGPNEPAGTPDNLGFGWHYFPKADFKLDCRIAYWETEAYQRKLDAQYDGVLHHLNQRK